MNRRCTDPKQVSYGRYGGRGITVCEEWANSFETFKRWALQNGYKEGLTLDRKDNNANYSPDNCRWITNKKQANNRRSNRIVEFHGCRGTLSEICDTFDLDYGLINGRIQEGWPVNKALGTPKYGSNKNHHLLSYNGKTQTVRDWARELGFKRSVLYERLRAGCNAEEALSKPVRRRECQ